MKEITPDDKEYKKILKKMKKMKKSYKPKMPKDVEAKVSIPTDDVIRDAAILAWNAIVELGVFKEKI